MTQDQIQICAQCVNKNFDPRQGLICGLTGKTPVVDGTCQFFSTSEKAAESTAEPSNSYTTQLFDIDEMALGKLRMHQDFYYAFMGGLFASIIGAIVWAVVSVAAKFQIGYMALGVGFLVGYAVRFFGAGIDKKFGILGGILSLLGCLGGNLFTQVGFIAQSEGIGYFETIRYLNPSIIVSLLAETFSPMDLLFYGLAVFEGYKFSFRKISPEEALMLKNPDYQANPENSALRLPLVIVSIVLIAIFIFFANKGVSGFKTFHYESGAKLSEGEMADGKLVGSWTFWYENGNKKQTGFYTDGRSDSTWQWFNESGTLVKIGNYKNGIEHGMWISFYDNGIQSDSGSFFEGRRIGAWKYWYESGALYQTGFFKRNAQDSIWYSYFENGKLNSLGLIKDGNPVGKWMTYYEDGTPESEIEYADNISILKNAWNNKGVQMIVNGNGTFENYSESGNLIVKGNVQDGKRTGQWFYYYDNGRQKEELCYRNDSALIINSWNPDGIENIVNSNGTYRNYLQDGSNFFEEGQIISGKKAGLWTVYHDSSDNVFQEQYYVNGVLHGEQNAFYENGTVFYSGRMNNGLENGQWSWYYENGTVSSTVNFVMGKKEGKQIFLDEYGEKTKEEIYENGILTRERLL